MQGHKKAIARSLSKHCGLIHVTSLILTWGCFSVTEKLMQKFVMAITKKIMTCL